MKILITGPESTGKTTLTELLSKSLNFDIIPEYSRIYLEKNEPEYIYEDLLKMAREHYEIVSKAKNENLILDTYLLNYKIWSEHKFNKVDPWIINTLLISEVDLILLMKPDIKWTFDPLRETPDDRDLLFTKFQTALNELHLNYNVIQGEGEKRLTMALDVIAKAGINPSLSKQS